MQKIMIVAVSLLLAGTVFAGDGKSCHPSKAKNVQLTGTIECKDGTSGEDCVRVFRVADSSTQYTICDESEVKLTSLGGSKVKISGKLVTCDKGEELMIQKAAKI